MPDIPRGVEVLVKKAAVDPAFKKLLLEKRAGAAEAIALKLEPAEAAMLAALGAATVGCNGSGPEPPVEGIRPDIPEGTVERADEGEDDGQAQSDAGIIGDFAAAVPAFAAAGGARPDPPDVPEVPEADEDEQEAIQQKKVVKPEDYVTRGIRPDRP